MATQVNHYGTNALGVLGIIFVLCKIFSVAPIADWSWWLVTAPFWGGLAIFAIFFLGVLLFVFIAAVIAVCLK